MTDAYFVERHYIKGTPEIIRLCELSKELYNRCNYLMRKAWFDNQHLVFKPLPDLNALVAHTEDLGCYQQLYNTKTAKQTIRLVLSDWSNFHKTLSAYIKDRSKFNGQPKPPDYKNKMAQVIFINETIKRGMSKKPIERLTPTKGDLFSIPFKEGYKQVVITPKSFGFVLEVRYAAKEKEKPTNLDQNKVCTVDLGVNTLAAITLDQNRPILVNGRIVKSINQQYNKRPCKSRLRKRYFRMENYLHHTSKLIVDKCVDNGIGTIIIGKNDGWKQGPAKLRKKTIQNFQSIPYEALNQKIRYKAEMVGIEVIETEESYTSKASFYDRDPLPKYDEVPPKFSGRRKHRGLYVSNGYAINADVNGSLNIGRKVIPEFAGIGDRSLAARPVTVNPLKASW